MILLLSQGFHGWYLNVSIALKTRSGWADTLLVCLYHIPFRDYEPLYWKKKLSASFSFLVIVSSVSLLIIVMDYSIWLLNMPILENSGFTVSRIFYYFFKSYYLDQQSDFFWLYVTQKFRFLFYNCLDLSVLVLRNLLRSLEWSIISFRRFLSNIVGIIGSNVLMFYGSKLFVQFHSK